MKNAAMAAVIVLTMACGNDPAAIQSGAVATASNPITFGQLDGQRHPNVGAAAFEPPGAPGQLVFLCSGTLISRNVFLTAGHCTAFLQSIGVEDVRVTFDPAPGPASEFYSGTYVTHPSFACCGLNDLYDVAVIVLDGAPGIAPAQLPSAGLLDELFAAKELSSVTFTAVGYGAVRDEKTKGPANILPEAGTRRFAEQTFMSLNKAWLNLSMQPSTGDGGTCYGDSGGPHFLEVDGSDVLVSVTSRGDVPCRATDKTYRIDTPAALEFIEQFIE